MIAEFTLSTEQHNILLRTYLDNGYDFCPEAPEQYMEAMSSSRPPDETTHALSIINCCNKKDVAGAK